MASAPAAPPEPGPAPAAAPTPHEFGGFMRALFEGLGIAPAEPPPPPVAGHEREVLLAAFRELWPALSTHALNPAGTEFSGVEDRGPDCKQLNIISPVPVRRKVEEVGWKPGAAPKLADLPPLVKGKAGR